MIETGEGIKVLFEVRAKTLHRQPGEICFPGGRKEKTEEPVETAIRETCEELDLSTDDIHILGALSSKDLYSGEKMHPFVGFLSNYHGDYSSSEVDHIFSVPLSFFLETSPQVFAIAMKSVPEKNFPYNRIPYGKKYHWKENKRKVYFYSYRNYEIWGLTAGILVEFVKRLHEGGL